MRHASSFVRGLGTRLGSGLGTRFVGGLGTRLVAGLVTSVALALLAAGSASAAPRASAPPRAPIVPSLELAMFQPPAIVTIDGVRQLVYELHITNLGATGVALTRVEVLDADRPTTVLADVRDAALQGALGRPGLAELAADPRPLGPGLRAVFYAWLPLASGAVPRAVIHRVALEAVTAAGRSPRVIEAGRASVRREPPIVLGPPLQGGRWVAVYGPDVDRGHRRFLYTLDGKTRIPARFAIDWLALGDDGRFSSGDRTKLASWHGYGARVIAVAAGTVVDARDDIAQDTPIDGAPMPIALENVSGNYVTLDLGGGRYAFYEHLQPGSLRVQIGARVRRGDVLAALGNTGSSSAGPHLHFHLSDANASLAAEGLPYVFDRFDALGTFAFPATPGGAPTMVPVSGPAARRRELPGPNTIVRF